MRVGLGAVKGFVIAVEEPQKSMQSKYPGWRTMTAAQRHNARQDRIWEQAKVLKTSTRFHPDSREDNALVPVLAIDAEIRAVSRLNGEVS